MAITNANVPGNPQGYNQAQHVLHRRAVMADDDEKAVRALVDMGKAMEGAHISLKRLTEQVKTTDKIFEASYRRGDTGLQAQARTFLDFYKSSEYLNKSFLKSFSAFDTALVSLRQDTHKATAHFQTYGKEYLDFLTRSEKFERERVRLREEEAKINEEIARQQKAQFGHLDDDIKGKRDLLVQQKAVLAAEKEIAEASALAAGYVAMMAATMGQALELTYKYQKEFKSLSMDFRQSIRFTTDVINLANSSGGLARMEDAAAAMAELRKQGISYFKDRDLQKSVLQIAMATDMSAGAAAELARQFKVLGGTTEEFRQLGSVFTYFSQQTELTADEVAHLVKASEPLISDFPRALQSKTITSILAVADAFKKAGLNAEDLVKRLDEMQDLTSGEGMKSAAMIAAFSGVSFKEMTMGVDVGVKMRASFEAQRNYMMRMMGGGLNIATAASIGSKSFGLGPIEDLKKIGRMTPEEYAARKKQIEDDEKAAAATEHLQEALNKLLQNPLAQLTAFFRSIEHFALGVGAKLLDKLAVVWWPIGKVLEGLTAFLAGPGGQALEGMATTLLFILPLKSGPIIKKVIDSWLHLGLVFTKGGNAADTASAQIDRQTKANERLAASASAAALATEKQAATQTEMSFMSGAGGLATGAAAAGAGKTAATLAKEEALLAKAGGKTVTKAGMGLGGKIMSKMTGLGSMTSSLFKWAGGTGAKFIPIVGGIVGVVAGLSSAVARGGAEGWNPLTIFQGVIDVVGGLLMGFGWVGVAISAVLQGIQSLIDWWKTFFGKKDEDKKKEEDERKAAAAASIPFNPAHPLGTPKTNIPPGATGGITASTALGDPTKIPKAGTYGTDKIGYFGYIGDESPDPNSLRGIGDHQNALTPGQSVALSAAGVKKRGLTQKGQKFQAAGRWFIWDDTIPASGVQDPNYIDVYNPLFQPSEEEKKKSFAKMSQKEQEDLFAQGPGGALKAAISSGAETYTTGGVAASTGAAGGGGDRVAPGGASLSGTDPRITEIVTAAARALPPGYTIKPTSGVRTAGQGQHTLGKAQDWQIIGPDGKPVPNRGSDTTGLYTTLARAAYGYQEKTHPELTGLFQWGGQFGTSASNPNEPDLMHFDIGGRRGRISRYSREAIGSTLPPQASAIPIRDRSSALRDEAFKNLAETHRRIATVHASVAAHKTASDVNARLVDRHLRELHRGDLQRADGTSREMLAEMKAGNRSTKEHYRRLQLKDFVEPRLVYDATDELFRGLT